MPQRTHFEKLSFCSRDNLYMLREHHALPIPWPMKYISIHNSNHPFNCSLFTNLEKVLKTMCRKNHLYLLLSLEYLKRNDWGNSTALSHVCKNTCLCFFQTQVTKVSLMMFPYHSKTKPALQNLLNMRLFGVNTGDPGTLRT